MKSIDKSKLMKLAWKIAKGAASDFRGYKASDFFRESLRQAWEIVKYPVNAERIVKAVGRIELDYDHSFSPYEFRMYRCQEYQVGIAEDIYHVPAVSVETLKNCFYANTSNLKECMELGAKCKISETSFGWLVKFDEIESLRELDKTTTRRIRNF